MPVWYSHDLVRPRGWEHPIAALTFLWDASLRRERVGGMPFLSPAFALLAPVAVYAAWHRADLRRLLVIASEESSRMATC